VLYKPHCQSNHSQERTNSGCFLTQAQAPTPKLQAGLNQKNKEPKQGTQEDDKHDMRQLPAITPVCPDRGADLIMSCQCMQQVAKSRQCSPSWRASEQGLIKSPQKPHTTQARAVP